MPLPPKEYYSISDVANKWSASDAIIEDYILAGKLQASVYLPSTMICKYTLKTDNTFFEESSVYDIDYQDPESLTHRSGLFNLIYSDINWDENGTAQLNKEVMCLTLPDEENAYFSFNNTYNLNKDAILITLSEIERFEQAYNLVELDAKAPSNINSELQAVLPTLENNVIKPEKSFGTREKENLLKIMLAMAIDSYDYDLSSHRNSFAEEISQRATEMGLQISADTVRNRIIDAVAILDRSVLNEIIESQKDSEPKRKKFKCPTCKQPTRKKLQV